MKQQRKARVERKTSETDIRLSLNLDGTGHAKISTGIGFLDHLLTCLARHSRFDVEIECTGDLSVDDHHTAEDCAICLGLQLLCRESEESPGRQGLGVVPATITRFSGHVRVPQFGWNKVEPEKGCTFLEAGYAYFAKSFCLAKPAAVEICDRLAPEHLEIHVDNAQEIARNCKHYGALFIGSAAAEVMGDYGAGPNHTLPTGGTARYTGGLSVLSFLRVRTWLRIDDRDAADSLARDAGRLAELEGLEAHARSARRRACPS